MSATGSPEKPKVTPPNPAGSPERKAGKEKGIEQRNEITKVRQLQSFLEGKHIAEENFDEVNLKTAIEFYSKKDTSNPDLKLFSDAAKRLDQWGVEEDFFNEDPKVFENKLNSLIYDNQQKLKTAGENPVEIQKQLKRAQEKYWTFNRYALRIVETSHQMDEVVQSQKKEVGASIEQQGTDIIAGMKENYEGLDGTQKMLLIGGGLLALSMVWNSDDVRMEKFKDHAFTIAKILGVGYIGNIAFKVATGHSALEGLSNLTKRTFGKKENWQKIYKAPPDHPEHIDYLLSSVPYMGDMKFLDLYDKYRFAKDHHSKEIDLVNVDERDMTHGQVYIALDLFFKRFPMTPAKLKEYRQHPNTTWAQALVLEPVISKEIEIDESSIDQAKDEVKNWFLRGRHWLGLSAEEVWDKKSEGWEWAKGLYRKTFGREGTEEEVKALAMRTFPITPIRSNELDSYVHSHVSDQATADGYVNTYRSGTEVPQFNLHKSEDNNYVYIIAHKEVLMNADDQTVFKASVAAREQAMTYLKKENPEVASKIDNFVTPGCSYFLMDFNRIDICMKMPKKGSEPYKLRAAGIVDAPENKDVFGPNDTLDELMKNRPWISQQIQIRSMFDSTQTDALKKLYEKLTIAYQRSNLTKEMVEKRIFTPENGDIENAVKEMMTEDKELRQHLKPHMEDLRNNLEEIKEIEDDARSAKLGDSVTKNTFIDKEVKSTGYLVRLALLQDSYAMGEVEYKPQSKENTAINTPEKLLKWYEKALKIRAQS